MSRVRVDQRAAVGLAAGALVATTALSLLGYRNLTIWEGEPPYRLGAPELSDTVVSLAAGWAFGIAGLMTMHRRPGNVTGLLMVLIGTSFLTLYWRFLPVPALVSLGIWAENAPLILLGILVLAYPSGHIGSRAARTWVGAALIYLFGVQVAAALTNSWSLLECLDCRPLITLSYDERIESTIYWFGVWALMALAAGLIALLIRRWRRASGPTRRQLTPVWLAGIAFTVVTVTIAFLNNSNVHFDFFSWVPPPGKFIPVYVPSVVWEVVPWLSTASLFVVPVALTIGLLRSQLGRAAVSGLAVELRMTDGRPPLVDSLQRALGDRTLELGLWSRPAAGYVTPEGAPLRLPAADSGRAVTRLDGDDGPLAAMIHDPALLDQPGLIQGTAAVAHLALENERLQAEVKAQLEEVRASRERIASAADAERRRVERDLHDGAQQRLVSLSLALGAARRRADADSPEVAAALEAAEAELKQAINELRELARGIHPAILTEAGLGPALESLADHSPLPVSIDSDLDERRLPPLVEATAYFVVAEALTNATKHASASHVTVGVHIDGGFLRLDVTDDGLGGADPARGSGLRGLLDRVAALGGRLRVEPAGTGGTHLEAEIPCA